MSPAATRAAAVLSPHTPFAEAIVRRQAERAGFSIDSLSPDQLRKIAEKIVIAASVFVDPSLLEQLRGQLL